MRLLLVLTAFAQLLTGALLFFLPAMERKGVFFGKRTGETPQIPLMTAQWRRAVIVITLACTIGATLGGLWAMQSPQSESPGRVLWIGFSILQAPALAALWLILRRRFEPSEPEAVDMNVRKGHLRRPPEPAQTLKRFLAYGPLLAIAAGIAYLALRWNQIPERFPLHWNIRGEVDRWGRPRLGTLVVLPTISVVIWAFLFWMLKLKPFEYMSQRRRFGFEMLLLGLMWMIVVPLCLTHVMMPFGNPETIRLIVLVHILAPVATAAVFVPIWLKISSRLSKDAPPTPAEINRDDDRYWRFGFLGIYYNPDDPAWWVERRYGVGPTPNLAHPQGKILRAAFILFTLVLLGPLIIKLIGWIASRI